MRDYILPYFYDTIKTMKRETKIFLPAAITNYHQLFMGSTCTSSRKVILGKVEGIINPVIEQFVVRLIEEGKKEEAKVILILLDTPGGLEESMRNMIKAILQSPIPVTTYVYPR